MRKILVVVNSLQAGGAERAAVRLAADLAQDGYEVILCTLNSSLDFYAVSKLVQRINYGDIFSTRENTKYRFSRVPLLRTLELVFTQFRGIRGFVRSLNPDVVIAFEALIGAVFAVSLVEAEIPIVISERVNPNPSVYAPHWVARFLRPWVYKHGAICTVQSQGFKSWVEDNWRVQALVTPNHLHDSEITHNNSMKRSNHKKSSVIAVGRHAEQKGYDSLLQAWRIVEMKMPKAKLSIFGDGDRATVDHLISKLELHGVKCFPATREIVDELVKHRILVSSSNFEGFPNVVLESMSCGVPVVATKSTDVVDDFSKKGGIRVCNVSDFQALANLIINTIEDDERYELMKVLALSTAMNYGWTPVKPFWEEVFEVARMSRGVQLVRRK